MPIMNTGLFPQDLRPGVKKWFGEYDQYETLYDRIFEVLSDDRAFVENALLSDFGLLQVKNQGQGVRYDGGKQGYSPRYDHFTIALGFQITMEMMQDGIALKNAKRFSEALKRSALQTDDVLAHSVLNNAFSTVTMTNGDGKTLIASDHPIVGSGSTTTVSNVLSVAADLSEAGLEQATIDIGNWVDDRGKRIKYRPKKLIVNLSNQFEAHRILKSQLRVASADHDINALRDMGVIDEVVVTPFTSNSNAWYVVTDCPDGLKFYNRMEATIDNDTDFDTASGKYKVMRRLSYGWDDFRGIYGTAGV